MSHHAESSSLVAPDPQEGAIVPARATGDRAGVDHEDLTTFLDLAAQEMKLPFDRVGARRRFGELDNDRRSGWVVTELNAIVVAAAPAFQMRVDSMPLNLAEAVRLVRPEAPLGLLRRNGDGSLGWTLLADHRGRRVKAYDSSFGTAPRWLTANRLETLVGEAAVVSGEWLALQKLLPCSSESHESAHGQTPWSRLLKLLSPDRGDIGVILVFAVVIGLLALSSPIAVEALVNTVAFGQFIQPVVVLATILGVFLAFAAAMRAVQAYIAEIIQRRLFVRIAGDLAHRLPRVRSEFWDRHYGPELTNRFFEVVTVQKVTTQLLLEGSSLLLQTLVGMAVIAFYHPILLGFDAFLLLFILSIIFVLGRGAVATSVDESRQKYATAAWLEDLARFPGAFSSRSAMAFAVEQADRRVASYLTARMEHFRILMRQVVASLALQVIASTVLLGLGGWLVIRGELSLGQLVAAELIVTVIVGSFAKIGKFLEGYYDVMASMDKLGHLFDMPIDLLDGVETAKCDQGIGIRLNGVATPATPSGERLKQVTLFVPPGDMLAVTGGSTALRGRLLEVIFGRVEPLAGRLEIDGMDARRLCLESFREEAALVSGPEIFQGTIAENIHLGRPKVREQDLTASLQSVGLWDELLALPDGLRQHLETASQLLSHDQTLRLTLARAFAGRPRLLLIDHALDGLPDEQMAPILGTLASLGERCTVVIATGRRDVFEACSRVVKIDDDGLANYWLKELSSRDSDPPRLLTNQN
jgi:ABC-type bacteriocin/lantibiotic exporter with double-glycine peptidase domain